MTRPLSHRDVLFAFSLNQGRISPSVREKGNCMKQASRRAADPVPALLPRAAKQPPYFGFVKDPSPTPATHH